MKLPTLSWKCVQSFQIWPFLFKCSHYANKWHEIRRKFGPSVRQSNSVEICAAGIYVALQSIYTPHLGPYTNLSLLETIKLYTTCRENNFLELIIKKTEKREGEQFTSIIHVTVFLKIILLFQSWGFIKMLFYIIHYLCAYRLMEVNYSACDWLT